MKNMTVNILAITFLFASTSSSLAFERETGGQHAPTKIEYNCFNRAQLADAPSVSVLVDNAGYREVIVSNRGTNYAYGLTSSGNDQNGSYFSGQNIDVFISADTRSGTVTLKELDLIYKCESATP